MDNDEHIYEEEDELPPECDPMFLDVYNQSNQGNYTAIESYKPIKQEIEEEWTHGRGYIDPSMFDQTATEEDIGHHESQIKHEPIYVDEEGWEDDFPNDSHNFIPYEDMSNVIYVDDLEGEYIDGEMEEWEEDLISMPINSPEEKVLSEDDLEGMPVLEREARIVLPKEDIDFNNSLPLPIFNPYPEKRLESDSDELIPESPPILSRIPIPRPAIKMEVPSKIMNNIKRETWNQQTAYCPEEVYSPVHLNLKRTVKMEDAYPRIKKIRQSSTSFMNTPREKLGQKFAFYSDRALNRMPKTEINVIPELIDSDLMKKEFSSLGYLTQRFMEFLKFTDGREFDTNDAAEALGSKYKRRIYDITNVMEGIGILEKGTHNNNCMRLAISLEPDIIDEEDLEANIEEIKEEIGILQQDEDELDHMILKARKELAELFEKSENKGYLYNTPAEIAKAFPGDLLHVVASQPGMVINIPEVKMKKSKSLTSNNSVNYHLRVNGVHGALNGYTIEEDRNVDTGVTTFFAKPIEQSLSEKPIAQSEPVTILDPYFRYNDYGSQIHHPYKDEELFYNE